MDPKPSATAKDFFVYLGTAVALYFSAGSLLSLWFAIINERFADALDATYYYGGYGYYNNGGATFAIAALIIVVPIFLFLSYYIRKDILRSPEKRDLAIRRWFVWFTLFVAGIAVAGDLVVLLHTFLQGEVTVRFILKVLSVLVVSGGIFSYYLYDLRRSVQARPNPVLLGITAIVVLASIVCGFITFGSPAVQRDMRLDSEREIHLSDIQWQVLDYWQTNEKLPASLDELGDDFSGYTTVPVDPETGSAYEYSVTGPLVFELCATFARDSDELVEDSKTMPIDLWDGGLDPRFQHEAGRACFSRTIDPIKYPPYSAQPMY